jgi:hypothetical protein
MISSLMSGAICALPIATSCGTADAVSRSPQPAPAREKAAPGQTFKDVVVRCFRRKIERQGVVQNDSPKL